jgi:hypothetical protein
MFPFPFSFIAPTSADIPLELIDNNFAMEFNGTDQNISINPGLEFGSNNSGDTSTYTSFSGCCWLKPTISTGYTIEAPFSFGGVVSGNQVNVTRGYGGAPVGQGLKINIKGNSPSFFWKAGNTTLDDGNWHHIAWTMTYDPSTVQFTIKVYVDGQPENEFGTTTPLTGVYGGDPAYKYGNLYTIGKKSNYSGTNGGAFYDGDIDEVAIWNKVLQLEDVQTIYNATNDNPGKCANLFTAGLGTDLVFWNRMGD